MELLLWSVKLGGPNIFSAGALHAHKEWMVHRKFIWLTIWAYAIDFRRKFNMVQSLLLDETFQFNCFLHESPGEDILRCQFQSFLYHDSYIDSRLRKYLIHPQYRQGWKIQVYWRQRINIEQLFIPWLNVEWILELNNIRIQTESWRLCHQWIWWKQLGDNLDFLFLCNV